MAGFLDRVRRLLGMKRPKVVPSQYLGKPKLPPHVPEGKIVGHRGVAAGDVADWLKVPAPTPYVPIPWQEVDDFLNDQRVVYVHSTNVRAGQYLPDEGKMILEFLDRSFYEYDNISRQEAILFLTAASKGSWVWDTLRIRGTKYGHRKPYRKVSGFLGA